MRQLIDMTEQRIGRWMVLKRAGNNKHKNALWLCRCECGHERVVRSNDLRRGKSQGCASCGSTTHGGKGTRLYSVWQEMRYRCINKNHHAYKYYGGRGIVVCREWNTFETFRDWALANGYGKGLSIDRINNNGNYGPDNCRWATRKQQHRNKRSNRYITINGVTKLLCEWAEIAGISRQALRWRHKNGWRGEYLLVPPYQRSELYSSIYTK